MSHQILNANVNINSLLNQDDTIFINLIFVNNQLLKY